MDNIYVISEMNEKMEWDLTEFEDDREYEKVVQDEYGNVWRC